MTPRRSGWRAPTPEELQPSFSQYEIREVIGRGGMGAVYKGWQKSLRRFVAIKILPPQLEDEEIHFTERFQREAQAMARFAHPGIVSVYDAGETPDGLFYFVMEYVEGTDVQKMVAAEGRLSPEHALIITTNVCEALAYAHRRGVIHRDIKPSNIMVDAEGQVKVADFGLAKIATDESAALVTGTHVRMGTPDFMAPESMIGLGKVDHRADLYAVGVMLYQMLTGHLPRGRFDPASQRIPGLDMRFDSIIDRALQPDPDKRYSSAAEIRTDLDHIFTESAPTDAAFTFFPKTLPTPEPTIFVADLEEIPLESSFVVSTDLAPPSSPSVLSDVASTTLVSLQPIPSEISANATAIGRKATSNKSRIMFLAVVLAAALGIVTWLANLSGAFKRRSTTTTDPRLATLATARVAPTPSLGQNIVDVSAIPFVVDEPPQVQTTPATPATLPKPTPVTSRLSPAEPANRFDELMVEGKQLRERGDMSSAITKYREAATMDGKNCAPIGELAMTYEKMGLADRASEHWRKVIDLGDANSLYFSLAQEKLKASKLIAINSMANQAIPIEAPAPDTSAPVEGIEAGAMLGLLKITSEDVHDSNSAKHFLLHIPIKARPKAQIEVKDLVIHVLFYDFVDNQHIVQTSANVNARWATPPADWRDKDTEELTVEYQLPKPAKHDTRKYYGYIVRVYYKQQLQAATAEPDRLAGQYPPPPTIPKEVVNSSSK